MVVPGIELSAEYGEASLHVLAYWVDPEHEGLGQELQRLSDSRFRRGEMMVEKVRDLGYDLSFERVQEIAGGQLIARPHIAQAMTESGIVRTEKQAFDEFISDDGPAYVPKHMERIGVHYYNARGLLERAADCARVRVEGIYSHFANADAADLASARLQLARFLEVLEWYDKQGVPPPVRHMANSGAVLQLRESHLDLVRPGILLYGVYPSIEVRQTIQVKPVLALRSRVVYFKVVTPGHPVSYGSTWQSDHPVRVVTVPVGYGDGYFRALSNVAHVLIRGKKYPVVGRVCMDQIMVNLEWETAYNGDVVTLLGADGDELITCEHLAEWAGTIPYEVLTNLNTRIPRVYV